MSDIMNLPLPPEELDRALDEALEPVRMLIGRATQMIGPTAETVADQLRAAGLTGELRSASTNPEIIWLGRAVNQLAPVGWTVMLEEIDGDVLRFFARIGGEEAAWMPGWTILPSAIVRFGEEFDRGEFPDLIGRPLL